MILTYWNKLGFEDEQEIWFSTESKKKGKRHRALADDDADDEEDLSVKENVVHEDMDEEFLDY